MRAAWVCALVAFLNATCWSIVTPPFQVPDEPDHVAYVQELAETGRLPTEQARAEFSTQEIYALNDLRQGLVRFKPQFPSISSLSEQRKLEHDLALPLPRGELVNAGLAAGEPPLYYALQAIPYAAGSAGNLLDQLQLMRLLSALLGGLTALFIFLFVAEALPAMRWAAVAGALSVAVMPLLGFISGGINPESMLVTVSAALFYVLARAFRRGFTPRLAAAIGLVAGIGILTKLNFVGLIPGVLLGLGLLTLRAARVSRRQALGCLAIALSIIGASILLFVAINLAAGLPALGGVSGGAGSSAKASILHELSYIWQFYLPALPGMRHYFPGIVTTRQLWFNGFVGLYGWVDTVFPGWVYDLALAPAAMLAILCLRALARSRAQLRDRAGELVVYTTIAAGLMALVGLDSYISEAAGAGPYWEPRYFLPLVPLLAVGLALAARGAGRRWGPTVGTSIVVLFFAHDLFSQLQVIARYYG
ncbi:MAG TPA: DUF2142 domain-containing protein [Solirubrobacteraceae bacterium]|nr:DUF2142 domain-containing protein [Solirubrobacteraceae bacterium]